MWHNYTYEYDRLYDKEHIDMHYYKQITLWSNHISKVGYVNKNITVSQFHKLQ